MGSKPRSGTQHVRRNVIVAVLGALLASGCTSDAPAEPEAMSPEAAYTAIVRWEIDRAEPIVDDNGKVEAPVIYLAAATGTTVDVGVQAAVIEATGDDAVIRFADDVQAPLDDGLEGRPVKDEGVMIVVDEFDVGQPSVDVRIVRYRSVDDDTVWVLQIEASDDVAEVISATQSDEAPA